MAIKAHLEHPSAGEGLRAAPRRALRLETSGFAPGAGGGAREANVTIHNISAAGLLIETALELASGERLVIDLPEAGAAEAVIVWRSERLYGCAFAEALGAGALAAAQLRASAPGGAALPAAMVRGPDAAGAAFGARINRLRRERGLTLADVASALGVSKPTVWAWEKGKAKPLPERLGAIAAALGVAADELAEPAPGHAEASALIEECRRRIASVLNCAPSAVRILIEF